MSRVSLEDREDSSQGLLRPELSQEGTQAEGLRGSGTALSPEVWGLSGSARGLAAPTQADFGAGCHWAIIAKQEQRESKAGGRGGGRSESQ